MPINEIKRVCFVGAGTMGCFNSLVAAIGGYEAIVYDVSEDALRKAPERHKETGASMVSSGFSTQGLIDAGLSRIHYTSNPRQAAEQADLLSESVPENPEIKRQIHSQFDKLCPPHAIMTTNTSTLLLSEIEGTVGRRDKFAALHFHLFGKLIDIVKGPFTSPEVIDILRRFAKSMGQTTVILKKEKDGYLHNTMMLEAVKAGVLLVMGGYGDKEDVDKSWMSARGEVSGPFGTIDAVGIDVFLAMYDLLYQRRQDQDVKKVADFLRPFVERGELGMKTGKGFYTYPGAAWQEPDFLTRD